MKSALAAEEVQRAAGELTNIPGVYKTANLR